MTDEILKTTLEQFGIDDLPSRCFVDDPELMSYYDYGFLSHYCDKEVLQGKYEATRPKVQFLIDIGVVDKCSNGVYIQQKSCDGKFVDEVVITNLSNRHEIVGKLIISNPVPFVIDGIHQKSKTGKYLYINQSIISTKKHKYTFSDWSDLKEILEIDNDLLHELKYAYSMSNEIRFRAKQEVYCGIEHDKQ